MDFSLDNQSTTKLADMTDQKAVDHQNETIAENAKKSKLPKRICLVGTVVDDDEVASAAKLFNVPVLSSETGKEFCDDDTWMTYYILKEFEGPIFENIYRAAVKNKILGPPALLSASKNVSDGLPQHNRPIYNYSMKGVVTTFTGIRKRDELTQLVHLIHFMGGSIRKEMNHRATHLICSNAYGEKYRYALTFRLNVVRSSWVLNAWENRNEAEFSATNETFTTNHRLKIFEGCRVAFIGFPDFEKANMADLLRSYNGIETTSDDDTCTHKVVDESTVKYDHGSEESKFFVVKAEWFWTRIAEGYAPEDDFLYKDYMQSIRNEQAEKCERRDSLINYSAKTQRKRKRLSRIVNDGTPVSAGKRRSSISDAGILSESLIDYTASPDKNETPKSSEDIVNEFSTKKFSMRHNHFMDFYHTESNYVGILETIVKLFKLPLEKMADENPDESDLLNKSEVKAIFSNFLPIYEVHRKMLNTLQEINSSWKEDCAIGQIILDNRDSLLKAYPPYVNFFEQMKTTLIEAAQSKPRFQAFLKINQAKPECGRQSLQDLMIRPVQRLPSISLLLNDILKHTPKANRDQDLLSEALKAIKEVMTYINEDKRKTEGQKQMFNIFNEIENCPPHLISSHRSFISRCECTELSETLSGRGDSLVLFLFTDTLVICKKRSRFHSSKSPNSTKSNSSSIKPYKHIKLIPLSSIRTLADIMDSPRAFAISLRSSINIQDMSKDKLYSFIGRAFSFTKTPSRKIRGSNVSLTPSTISSMSHLKLQSSLTLNDFDMERKTHDSVPVPLTDQMSRKNMNPTGLGDM
ncbi:CLUMA_CG013280, isoform B [Clunio marinus]|uniref:CLUMA_CG013280, isoform B n=1 Tax=Clunio marinus TaxID=568069 RepID=A0A1J1IIB3_9DIPT|nr:CLUMA_CG013280, isoform B [Clunio marinus]